MVYAIGLHSQIMGRTTKPERGLRKLADETGGGYFELTKTADLGPTFTRVADELHRQYVLGFTPQTLDGRMHKLDVKVKLPGMQVRARKSYLASKGGVGRQMCVTAWIAGRRADSERRARRAAGALCSGRPRSSCRSTSR